MITQRAQSLALRVVHTYGEFFQSLIHTCKCSHWFDHLLLTDNSFLLQPCIKQAIIMVFRPLGRGEKQSINVLQPKTRPSCREPNRQDAQSCNKCSFVISCPHHRDASSGILHSNYIKFTTIIILINLLQFEYIDRFYYILST